MARGKPTKKRRKSQPKKAIRAPKSPKKIVKTKPIRARRAAAPLKRAAKATGKRQVRAARHEKRYTEAQAKRMLAIQRKRLATYYSNKINEAIERTQNKRDEAVIRVIRRFNKAWDRAKKNWSTVRKKRRKKGLTKPIRRRDIHNKEINRLNDRTDMLNTWIDDINNDDELTAKQKRSAKRKIRAEIRHRQRMIRNAKDAARLRSKTYGTKTRKKHKKAR